MPRIFGSPSPSSAAALRTRDDVVRALRHNDQKALLGLGDDDDRPSPAFGLVPFSQLVPGIETHRFRGISSYLAAGTGKVWASARAIDIIASVVLSTELKLVWRDPQQHRSSAALRPPPDLLRLLQTPNPHDTISELLYLWVCHIKYTGNAFWFKDELDAQGRPRAVYALNPACVRIVPDAHARVQGYVYRVNGVEIPLSPEEIIHFRRPHAADPLWGLGEFESGQSLFDEFINRALFNTRFMANGAMPSSVLVNEEYQGSQEDWDRMKAVFTEQYGGVNNAGKVAWMNGKWRLLQMGLDAEKMQELEKSRRNVEEIFVHHGVPLSVAGFGSANYATAQVEDRAMRRYAVLPLLNLFCDAMNSARGFISAFAPELRLDFSLSGLVDVEQVMKDHGPLFDRGGLTPNELRALAGLPRIEDPLLDRHYVADDYVPLAATASPAASAARPTPEVDIATAEPKFVVDLQTSGIPAGSVKATARDNRIVLELAQPARPRRVAVRKTASGYEISELKPEPTPEHRHHHATIELCPR